MPYNRAVKIWVLAYLYFTARAGLFEARFFVLVGKTSHGIGCGGEAVTYHRDGGKEKGARAGTIGAATELPEFLRAPWAPVFFGAS